MGVIMEMFSALWQVGVFAAVILFGTKLGIASGLAKISKRNFYSCIGLWWGNNAFVSYRFPIHKSNNLFYKFVQLYFVLDNGFHHDFCRHLYN